MKKPTWVNVVGIITIIMGCFGLLGALQTFSMPKVMAMQRQMMPEIQKRVEQQSGGQQTYSSPEMTKMLEKMGQVPSWFDSWCMAIGTVAFLISILYIFVAINLLQLKKMAIGLFYTAVALDICFLLIRGMTGFAALGWLGVALIMWGAGAIILNVILLVAVMNGRKEMFN